MSQTPAPCTPQALPLPREADQKRQAASRPRQEQHAPASKRARTAASVPGAEGSGLQQLGQDSCAAKLPSLPAASPATTSSTSSGSATSSAGCPRELVVACAGPGRPAASAWLPAAPPSTSGRAELCLQCGEQPSSILPPSVLALRLGCAASGAPRSAFADLTAHDLRLPPQPPPLQPSLVTDKVVEGMVGRAQQLKREVDACRGAGYTVHHVADYTRSALQFMEACEAMLMMPHTRERLS